MSSSVSRPYISGSRTPSKLRFGPFRTRTVPGIRASTLNSVEGCIKHWTNNKSTYIFNLTIDYTDDPRTDHHPMTLVYPIHALKGAMRVPRSAAVLLVADLFHPVDVLAVERFRNSDMRHRGRRCRAVPVLLAGWKPDDIAGTDFFDRSALGLRPAKAGRDDQGLTERMGVPCGAGAGLEGDVTTAEACRVAHLEHRVHTDRAGEPGLGAFAGRPRAVALDIHRFIPPVG